MSGIGPSAAAVLAPIVAFGAEIGRISCTGVSLAPAGATSAIPQVANLPEV